MDDYMSVEELNKQQLEELKCRYYIDNINPCVSYGELADIDELVSDEEVYEYYGGTMFVNDDFSCSCGE